MSTIATELTVRVCIITCAFSIISYAIIHNIIAHNNQSGVAIPLLFVVFGVVILISVLFCLRKYHVWNAKKNGSTDANKS